jgi:uncharacterized protein (TIGR00725 family)
LSRFFDWEQGMARKIIVAAIGGNGMPDVTSSAFRFGEELSDRAILLTGGMDPLKRDTDVKTAAMFGAQGARGLLISVLPKQGPACRLQGRQLILETGLVGKYARNPITGSAADVVVVFPGAAGTLVELAYAALQGRPIIFLSSIKFLRVKCSFEAGRVRTGLIEAKERYPLISTNEDDLEHALVRCLANPQAICVDKPKDAVQEIFSLVDQPAVLASDTNFLGLPGDKERWKKEFNAGVAALSGPPPA